jgi:cell division septal protein FtsQ
MVTQAKHARSGRVQWIVPVSAVLFFSACLWFVIMTDSLSLKEVHVLGSTDLPMDSLRTVMAGLVGRNVFTVSLGRIREELMRFPEVKEVTFRRRFFRRLDCYLKKREPVLLIAAGETAGNVFLDVDAESVIIPRRSTQTEIDLPVVTGIEHSGLLTEEGMQKIHGALEVLHSLKLFGFDPAEQLSEIHFEGEEMIVILMGSGSSVLVGTGGYREKIRKLRAVYAALDEQEPFPDLIDLRFEHQVVVR